MSKQSCGTCKWGEFHKPNQHGHCKWPVPDLVWADSLIAVKGGIEERRWSVPSLYGTDCPTWEAKPITIFEAAERLGEPLGLTGPEFLAKAEGESE